MSTEQVSAKESASLISDLSKRLIANVETVIAGKAPVIQKALVALFCEGHILIEDVPGVAKTVLAKSIAKSIGCTFKRVQCTPDLLPSDITGISIFNQKLSEFEFRPGPAFANILLADELNRATPRTQSSLLECMAEGQITIDTSTYKLASPFLVFATQNPIEYEGTFPLPEAQLDRFCMKLSVGYPKEDDEIKLLERLRLAHPVETLSQVATAEEVLQAQAMVKQIFVHEEVRKYAVRLVRATRIHDDIAVGASPRASIALFRASQALAAMHGVEYVVPDCVKILAPAVLEHRIILKPEARLSRKSPSDLIQELLDRTPAPKPGSKP